MSAAPERAGALVGALARTLARAAVRAVERGIERGIERAIERAIERPIERAAEGTGGALHRVYAWCVGRGRRRSALPALVVAVAPPALAQPGPPAPAAGGRGPRVEDVALPGVTRVPEDALRDALATRESECKSALLLPLCWVTRSPHFVAREYLDSLELRRDALRIRLFYWKRGYRDAGVVTRVSPHRGGVRVTFAVTEGPPTVVSALSLARRDAVLDSAAVARALLLRAGDPLDLLALDSSVVRLERALWERGHADAVVTADTAPVVDSLDRGAVALAVRPGPRTTVAAVRVEGNARVSDATVRRFVTLRPGDLFRRGAVLASQRNLYLSGLFSAVEVGARPTADSSKVVVVVRVAEGPHRHVALDGGFNTVEFLQLDGEFTRRNFLGGARRLSANVGVGNLLATALNDAAFFRDVTSRIDGRRDGRFLRPTLQASVDFTQPWAGSPRNQLGLVAFAHRRVVPGIVIDRGYGASAALTRTLAPGATGTLSYRAEATATSAGEVYFCVAFGFCEPATIRAVAAPHTLAPLALTARVERTNDPLAPTAGYTASADAEHASALTASDFRYHRVALEGTAYRPVGRAVLAGRVRAGWVGALAGTAQALGVAGLPNGGLVHPRKRFYAGGALSVRGFGENQLGPRVLTVAPGALTDGALPDPCTRAQLAARTCDPNLDGVSSRAFLPQPTGGSALLAGSVEYRFPLGDRLKGVVFVDAAVLGEDALRDLFRGTGAVTPGFGVHFATPAGPVRLEVGVRPTLAESLPVVTQVADSAGARQLVRLRTPRRYDPLDARGGGLMPVLRRLTVHLAVGPSF